MTKWQLYIEAHPEVAEWLKNRPLETKRSFTLHLQRFCDTVGLQPEEWRKLPNIEARDLAWKFIQPKIAEHPSVAKMTLTALKSWYRNLNGEVLAFDSRRGGKHYFHVTRKKAAVEHIPSKKEMFQIVDMTSSLRDKAILLMLFQAGVRVNVLEHVTYEDVADQLDQETIALKITERLDHKLRGRDIPFYYTFLDGEGAEALKQYCKVKHKDRDNSQPLFYTRGRKAISQKWILKIVKMCASRAGFNPSTLCTQTLRKAFRKIVRQANIDDDDKEQLMGHVILGSREAYYSKKDVPLILEAYRKCNFSRELLDSEISKLRRTVEFLEENGERKEMEIRRLREQAAENIELKRRIQQTEEKLTELEKLIRKTLEES